MKRICIIFMSVILLLSILIILPQAALTYAVNNLAEQCTIVVSAKSGEDAVFRDADIRQALGVASYPSLTILSLPDPSSGVLKLGTLRVSAGQVIHRSEVGRLTFTPTSELVSEACFTLRIGNLSGGAALKCFIRFQDKVNNAPTAAREAAECFFSTRKNASLWGTMAGYDPDGDALTYLIVSYPENGTLRDVDASAGGFRYTPRAGFSGRDSFSYVVRDAYGNYSAISKVDITVDKRTWDIELSDTAKGVVADAAYRMVNANIMSVERNGYAVYFHPSGNMNRAEFLVAAMKATGNSAETSAAWRHDDHTDIPVMARPYVDAATAAGYLTPTWEAGLYFHPDKTVTCAEAYRLLTRILGEEPRGIGTSLASSDKPLTRGTAAIMLLAASRTV